MNSERSQAYGRVVKALDDLSASKLHQAEQDAVRNAADALFFCEDLSSDAEARSALDALESLIDGLIDSERLTPETGGRLLADVQSCGPLVPIAH
jgi:hypothetical protein